MDSDRFINTTKNFNQHQNIIDNDNNFFLHTNKMSATNNAVQTEHLKHINDYDANILKEDAYKDVNDEVFKLEYKIAKTEEELKDVNKQIRMANEIYDYYTAEQLTSRKIHLESELSVLNDLYKEASLSAKISGDVTAKIRDRFTNAGKRIGQFAETLLSKIPGKISSIIEIKNSLNKLESINKSVDELMKSQYPYGESVEKYERLSKYIARANTIQSEIYKFIK